jgi:hypothetical protein
MRLFRRGPAEPEIGDFWTWWPGNHHRIAAAITAKAFDDGLVEDISGAVRTIHPAMAWELGPGRTAEHAFCISPEGNPAIRPAALRWLAAAPAADATWEFYASKQAAPSLSRLNIGGASFDFEEMRAIASWDAVRQREDARLWHPGFPSVPEDVRVQVGFLFLDNLLGEDAVERWVGEIDILDDPTGGRTPAELKAEIDRRSTESASGDEHWVLSERHLPNGQVEIIVADASLKRIDHPFADRHAVIRTLAADDRWLPNAAEGASLDAEEDDLVRRLDGVAGFAGHTTSPGQRVMHFVTTDTDALRPAIDGWAADIPDSIGQGGPARRIKVDFGTDVDWSFQKTLGVR